MHQARTKIKDRTVPYYPAWRNIPAELLFGLSPIHATQALAKAEMNTGGTIIMEPTLPPRLAISKGKTLFSPGVFLLQEAVPLHAY